MTSRVGFISAGLALEQRAQIMQAGDSTPSLTRLSTNWNLLFQAHRGQGDAVLEAQRLLMQRYCGAVYRYLLTNVRNPDLAEELSQEFALRFLQGDFRRADPARGRFRDFVKTSLFHLLADHYRAQQGQHRAALQESPGASLEVPADELAEKEFLSEWRTQLLNCAWAGLAAQEGETGQLMHRVLLWRAENPKATALALAAELTAELGKPFNAAGIRQILHRARTKFRRFADRRSGAYASDCRAEYSSGRAGLVGVARLLQASPRPALSIEPKSLGLTLLENQDEFEASPSARRFLALFEARRHFWRRRNPPLSREAGLPELHSALPGRIVRSKPTAYPSARPRLQRQRPPQVHGNHSIRASPAAPPPSVPTQRRRGHDLPHAPVPSLPVL